MTDADSHLRIWGIIPAAGMSRRIGRPKQTLAFHGSTVAATVVHTLLEVELDGVVVVTRTELINKLQLPADSRVCIAVNDNTDSEMIDSIRIGLSRLTQLQPHSDDGVLVVPGDMPTLTTSTCCACIEIYRANPRRIVIATHKGRRGHPIIFPFSLRSAVDALTDGLRMLPRTFPERVLLVETEDPGVQLDVDTTQDYDQLSAGA